jgi:NAD(P)-dependent dehydrogenase (short-subunit alcohol dehydrogenase family)
MPGSRLLPVAGHQLGSFIKRHGDQGEAYSTGKEDENYQLIDQPSHSAVRAVASHPWFGPAESALAPRRMPQADRGRCCSHSPSQPERSGSRTDLEAFKAERTARIPLGRRSDPEEMAQVVVWLATEAPDYMTTARLNVTGGLDKD